MNIFANVILWIVYVASLYFSIFLLLVYFDKKELFKTETSDLIPLNFPTVTVIIPAYNEEANILRTLKSAYEIDYPRDKIEIIVVDDGSKDKTREIITEYIKDKANCQLLYHKNRGKAASMNRALDLAKGEFFACLDADSFVDAQTLRKMLSIYYKANDPRLAIITPAMKVYKPKNLLQKVQWLEYLVIILISRISSHLDSLYVAPGPFSLYKTEIIRNIGGFDEKNIVEDQEIAYRIQKKHYKMRQCPDGYVYTTAPHRIKPFYKQRRRWYLGSILCIHKYKELVANKKYGDFGLIQMVKNIAGYIFALAGIFFAIYLFITPLWESIKSFMAVNFNLLPLIQNFNFDFRLLNFLLLDFRKGFIIIFIFIVGFFFFYAAHRNANEKMMKFGFIALIPYFAFYYVLKGIILLLSLFEFARTRKLKW